MPYHVKRFRVTRFEAIADRVQRVIFIKLHSGLVPENLPIQIKKKAFLSGGLTERLFRAGQLRIPVYALT